MSTLKVNAITETDGSAFPFGKILQVVSVSDSVRESTGSFSCSQTYVDTVFAVTITPTSSSNKMVISAFFFGEASTNEHEMQFVVERAISGGATTTIQGAASGNKGTCIAVPHSRLF